VDRELVERRELAEHVCYALLSPGRRAHLDKFTYNTLARWAAAVGNPLPEWCRHSVGRRGDDGVTSDGDR
jgi:hypothetical protein